MSVKTLKTMLEKILASEEEHADEFSDFLAGMQGEK